MDLTEARGLLQAESNELDILKVALSVVYDDLLVLQVKGTSSLMACAVDIMTWVCRLEKEALRLGITQAITIAHTHYDDNIDFEAMSLGFMPGYEPSELDDIEATVTPFVKTLVSKIKDMVLPERE